MRAKKVQAEAVNTPETAARRGRKPGAAEKAATPVVAVGSFRGPEDGAAKRPSRTAKPAAPEADQEAAHNADRVAPAAPGSHKRTLVALEDHLGYRFADLSLLQLALTHSSFIYEGRLGRARTNNDEPNQPGTDNEQLEFLGDAVLGMAVTELLLREFPARSEGELTRMRASLVSRKRMAELGEALGLGALLHMGKSAEASDGRRKMAVLANSTEALIGAIYLDVARGADARARGTERALRTVRELLQRLLVAPDLPAIRAELAAAPGRGAMRDAKSRLQERVQAERAGQLLYVDVDETGPAHARVFTVEAHLRHADGGLRVLARAEGGSKKEAQQTAAGEALQLPDLGSSHPSVSGASRLAGAAPRRSSGSVAAAVAHTEAAFAGQGRD